MIRQSVSGRICLRCNTEIPEGYEVFSKHAYAPVSCLMCTKPKGSPASKPSVAKAIEESQALAIVQFNKWRAEKLARGEACNL